MAYAQGNRTRCERRSVVQANQLCSALLTSANAALMNAQNAGRYRIAEFRQEWIDKVIDILSEQHAILATHSTLTDSTLMPEDQKKVALLGMKLGLLLNPEEDDTVALIEAMDKVVAAKTVDERAAKADAATVVARRLLKREWTRLKNELGSSQAGNANGLRPARGKIISACRYLKKWSLAIEGRRSKARSPPAPRSSS
jgi:hypothetical protein